MIKNKIFKKITVLSFQLKFLLFFTLVGIAFYLFTLVPNLFNLYSSYKKNASNKGICESVEVGEIICDTSNWVVRESNKISQTKKLFEIKLPKGQIYEVSAPKFVNGHDVTSDDAIHYLKIQLPTIMKNDEANLQYAISKITNDDFQSLFIPIALGFIPLIWLFFLNRLAEISNALRGNKK